MPHCVMGIGNFCFDEFMTCYTLSCQPIEESSDEYQPDAVRARSLVVSDLCSETKGSWFESGC